MWRISGVIDDGLVSALVEMVPEMAIRLLSRTTVESCVLLERVSNRKADSYVKLNVKMEDYYRIKDAEKKTDE